MNTTMADGAEQRLDAQIAEALFGQPGMSKMDVANRVRELRGDGPALLVGRQPASVGQIDAETLWWLQDAINTMAEGGNQSHVRFLQRLHDTLSVHPSPGGQDAPEIEQLQQLVSSILNTVSLGYQTGPYAYAGEDFGAYLHEATGKCRTVLRALSALAARQPMGEVSVKKEDANNYCLILRALGMEEEGDPVAEVQALIEVRDRQPVGQEPITVEAAATVRRDGEGDRYIDWLTEGGIADLEVGDVLIVSDRAITDEDGSGKVYTAPPAQSVGEPVAWMDPDGSRVLTAKAKANASGTYKSATSGYTVPLYPPAQAVDLERFRPAVMTSLGLSSPNSTERETLRELLALIDGKAVGNGR